MTIVTQQRQDELLGQVARARQADLAQALYGVRRRSHFVNVPSVVAPALLPTLHEAAEAAR